MVVVTAPAIELSGKQSTEDDWKKQYPWHLPVSDHDDSGEICSHLCELCQRYRVTQRNGAGT